jgi:hypothetical protein
MYRGGVMTFLVLRMVVAVGYSLPVDGGSQ